MKFRILILTLVATTTSIALPGCERKAVATGVASPTPAPPTVSATVKRDASRLSAAVDAYAHEQNPENDAAVRKAMADVDSEILQLEDLVAKRHGRDREKVAAKMRRLQANRSEETTRFAEIQAGR